MSGKSGSVTIVFENKFEFSCCTFLEKNTESSYSITKWSLRLGKLLRYLYLYK